MKKIKLYFWKLVADLGDLLGNIGDDLLVLALDKINDIAKLEWIENL